MTRLVQRASVRELFTHVCYNPYVIKMRKWGEWKLTWFAKPLNKNQVVQGNIFFFCILCCSFKWERSLLGLLLFHGTYVIKFSLAIVCLGWVSLSLSFLSIFVSAYIEICIYSVRIPSFVRNKVPIKLILFFEVWIWLRIEFESRQLSLSWR
jgi:hypothetical protein